MDDTETYTNKPAVTNFTVTLNNLRAGTEYDFLTRLQNDLTLEYSISDNSWNNVPSVDYPFNSNGPIPYTDIPGSGSYTFISPAILTYNNTTAVTTSSLNNSNIIYINIYLMNKWKSNHTLLINNTLLILHCKHSSVSESLVTRASY